MSWKVHALFWVSVAVMLAAAAIFSYFATAAMGDGSVVPALLLFVVAVSLIRIAEAHCENWDEWKKYDAIVRRGES